MRQAHLLGTPLDARPAPDFTLTDQYGHPWTLSQQHERIVALYFGLTHCKDTCPTTVAKLARAITNQGSRAKNAEIAFVTIDPQRDTPPILGRFIARFDGARIIGLTGTPAQIASVERSYAVWAQKVRGDGRSNGDYDETHSSVTYLIGRDGRERVVHDDADSLASIASDIHALLE
ncbi:MAG TPA: SCO family protein [Candidatus Cybelea sp.]|nr:SCO family protein [Candidatus Cybelea sp.]